MPAWAIELKGWGQRRFRLGSGLVQIWFRFGPGGQRRFRFGSDLARLGAKAVHIGFTFGSHLGPGGKGGSDFVQIWFRYAIQIWSDVIHIWLPCGSDLVQILSLFGGGEGLHIHAHVIICTHACRHIGCVVNEVW